MIKLVLITILDIIFLLIPIFGGAAFIYDAIHTFIRKQYFRFGLNTMMAIYFTVSLIKRTLGGF